MKKMLVPILALISVILCVVMVIILCNKKEEVWNNTDSSLIEFTYTINGGVPYKWEFEIEDEGIVSFVKDYILEDKNVDGLVGAPISTNYVFKGEKEGVTTVTFKYIDLTKKNTPVVKKEVHKLRVDKNKKISLLAL